MFGSVTLKTDAKKNDNISYENFDVLRKYSFLNQEIVNSFFTDTTFKLPTLSEIGELHGGMTKSGICKKLGRFYKKLKKKACILDLS